ncbi:hypothetical protein HDU81_005067 [Chytriomyces hyalinus]|nr:hypothetical protein HDU81_005067 [Chytriomyces hyalinus]
MDSEFDGARSPAAPAPAHDGLPPKQEFRDREPERELRRRDSRSRSPRDRGGRDRERGGRDYGDSHRPARRHISPSARGVPEPSKVLGVFGLSILTKESDLDRLFGAYGRLSDIAILYDKHTGKSRGFGFITFEEQDCASKAREAMNGYEFNERRMRVDYSLTKSGHGATPGQYLGRPEQVRRGSRDGGSSYRDDRGGYRDDHRGGGGYRDERPGGYREERGGGYRGDAMGPPPRFRDDRGMGYRDDRMGGPIGGGSFRDERISYRDDRMGGGGYRDDHGSGGSGYPDRRANGGGRMERYDRPRSRSFSPGPR